MIFAIVATVAVLLGASAVATWFGVAAIERKHSAGGRFVDVPGGRLHIVELGSPDRPAVVLLHGATAISEMMMN